MNILPKARSNNIVVQELGKEVLIYDLNTHKVFNLNETSSVVYRSCDGLTSFEGLKSNHKFADEIIFLALDELKKENLIEDMYDSPFKDMSRRDVIRKVGFGSIIALPVISALVAPTAARAQSATCSGVNRFCTSSAQCCASAPNCNVNRCCVGTGTLQPTFFYFVDAGQCTAQARSNCCSGNGNFISNVGGVIDRCQCT